MFRGREKELSALRGQFSSPDRTAVLVYGKRRIGKSTLIQEAAKGFDGTVISHLCSKTTYKGNLDLLCRSVCVSLGLPTASFATIFDLFDFLKAQGKRVLLVIDEYQYFKQSAKDTSIDSYMQIIIDSLPENIKLVLCGSCISIMKELLTESNPLFGRFTLTMRLEEFDYYDAALFYPELPEQDKIAFYAVFGGSPYVLSNIDAGKSLEENITALLINQNSLLRTYIENVMLSEIQQTFDVRVFEVIGNGKRRYSEIVAALGNGDNGLLDKQLKNLIAMDSLSKLAPINKPDDKKRQFYEIKDNLMRFYFSFVFGNDSLISKFGEAYFFRTYIQKRLNTFISYRFEGVAQQYFMRLVRCGKLDGVLDVGSYWYDDKSNKTNGQFDCVLKMTDGYDFFEVKYYASPMQEEECRREEEQVRKLTELDCRKMGFLCSSGFAFTGGYTLLSARDLYADGLA